MLSIALWYTKSIAWRCSFSYWPITRPKISWFFTPLCSVTQLQFLVSPSLKINPPWLWKAGRVCLLSSPVMAPLRTGITRSPSLAQHPNPCMKCRRFYRRSAVDMTLFMGAHNQVLMFAGRVAIMYLWTAFRFWPQEYFIISGGGVTEWLLLNHSTLANCSMCFVGCERQFKCAKCLKYVLFEKIIRSYFLNETVIINCWQSFYRVWQCAANQFDDFVCLKKLCKVWLKKIYHGFWSTGRSAFFVSEHLKHTYCQQFNNRCQSILTVA